MQARSETSRRAFGWLLVTLVPVAAWLVKSRPGALAAIREQRVVRVGYAIESPFAFVDRSGRVTGVDPETVRLVAARLGWTIEWVQTEFDALIPQLLEARFDLVAAGMFVTLERERVVRFAPPHLKVKPGLLVRAGNPGALHGYSDLKAAGGRVAVLAGSVEERQVRALAAERVLTVPDARAGAAAVETGLADALALSLPTVRTMAQARPGLAAVRAADGGAMGAVAVAFRPGDQGLLAAWSAAQAAVVGSDAQLRAIAPFGFERDDVVQDGPGTGRSAS